MILALKTAGATTQIWLIDPSKPTQSPVADWESGRNLSDELLGKIENILKNHKASFKDLSGLVIFSGPGSFTSLRIGHTVLNALADSLRIPVVGAKGDGWLSEALGILDRPAPDRSSAEPGVPALPFYGSEAHITRPKA